MDLVDLAQSRAARDHAIAQVTESHGSWVDDAIQALAPLVRSGREMTGEDIRVWLLDQGFPEPHPNAWGGLTIALCKRRVIQDTGRLGQMKSRRSHARRTPIWVFA